MHRWVTFNYNLEDDTQKTHHASKISTDQSCLTKLQEKGVYRFSGQRHDFSQSVILERNRQLGL